nr:NERD domain-containing protein [Nostoc sp. ChiSLP03a]MDZ8215860.1 NERD domain-containing protein [Nostoc sp. ChiSLP03a]
MVSATQEYKLKFITTEPIYFPGQKAEQKVWDVVRSAFNDRKNCLCFWTYPIFIKGKQLCYEPDILIVDQEFGVIVIEVKNIKINQITHIKGYDWFTKNFYKSSINPYKQAESQLQYLVNYCNKQSLLERKVRARALVALPSITEKEWIGQEFNKQISCPPILFQEHLSKNNLIQIIIQNAGQVQPGRPLTDKEWNLLQKIVCSPIPPIRPDSADEPIELNPKPPRRQVIEKLQQWVGSTDIEQIHIGMSIPPGPQRIRGIAGSGKTVLLCQKAAWMHWYHPDWDIALVFFTRSLYDQAVHLVNEWLKFFSNDKVEYDPETSKLKILHAWGDDRQPGLYSTIHDTQNISLVHDQRVKGNPPEKLAYLCKRVLSEYKIQPIFDAILIDEGQDLALDEQQLKFEDKQSVYWLAWQALRPVAPDTPDVRRLIWAYDEAQSLDALSVPTSKEVLGAELSQILGGKGGAWYEGGIRKAYAMRHCYRTPGNILTAAHAIGMGWLRPEGMLTGITNKKDWEHIGYEVDGDFRKIGEPITISRPLKNSPNPVHHFWSGDLLEFNVYASYEAELDALRKKIHQNIHCDGLKPSRDILVIVLGSQEESINLQKRAAQTLQKYGVDSYIPSALNSNQFPEQMDLQDKRPNQFWQEEAVTVSRIYRAKGNEAYMVHLIGFNNIAKNESSISLRNQLFVALTRSKAWISLSGVGESPMCEEMRQAIKNGNTFTFNYKKPLGRVIGEEILT